MAANVLILGFGNPICGDDAVAWHIVDALEDQLPEGAVVAIHQLTPEWADPISKADHVIFVDAAVEREPGEVRCFPMLPAGASPGSHEMTPSGILSMAADVYGRCPPAHMVTVTGEAFGISESLTPAIAAAVPHAVTCIRDLLQQIGVKEGINLAIQ